MRLCSSCDGFILYLNKVMHRWYCQICSES